MSRHPLTTIQEDEGSILILDQTLLPGKAVLLRLHGLEDSAEAIRVMRVRGAPLIGATAAYGMALGLAADAGDERLTFVLATLAATRPTAVNLHWALARMAAVLRPLPAAERGKAAWQEARTIAELDRQANAAIGVHGLPLLAAIHEHRKKINHPPFPLPKEGGDQSPPPLGGEAWPVLSLSKEPALSLSKEPALSLSKEPALSLSKGEGAGNESGVDGAAINVMTHCNAGWLATVAHGTALAPVYAAHGDRLPIHVWVSETRPRNQGLLTEWELRQGGVPHTLIADNAAGLLLMQGRVDCVIVGADRIAANGDTANKVGTYLKALAARAHGVPFYVAAPTSTIDFACADGSAIPIEERSSAELGVDGAIPVANPAFDVTPAALITAIITERGVFAADALGSLAP